MPSSSAPHPPPLLHTYLVPVETEERLGVEYNIYIYFGSKKKERLRFPT